MSEKTKLLIDETISQPERVDLEQGVLHNCLLLGQSSRNGTDYPHETREQALPLLEGCKVNLSHPEKRDRQSLANPVPWDRRIGKAFNLRNANDGIRGDVKVLKKHPFFPTLMESATEMPDMFGFSPIMLGITRKEANGRETCLQIKKVKSIDLVTDPGTTRTLFEDEDFMTVTSKLLQEEEAPSAEHEEKKEEEGQAEHEELTPDEAHEFALFHAILAEVESFLDAKGGHEDALKRIGEHLKHHAKMHHKQEEEESEEKPEAGEEKKDEEKKEEEKHEHSLWDFPSEEGKPLLEDSREDAQPKKKFPVAKAKSGLATSNGKNGLSEDSSWLKKLRS